MLFQELRHVNPKGDIRRVDARILNQLGLDHKRLTFLHNGRGERATINGGNLITELL